MKKIISVVVCLMMLSSCSLSAPQPTKLKDFSKNASISVGSFSYNANVKWKNSVVYITATSTNAKGLTLSCDGSNVTFSRKAFSKSADINSVSSYNPAVILYQILSNESNPQFDRKSNLLICEGNSQIGKYRMYVDANGEILKISLNDDRYCINFS